MWPTLSRASSSTPSAMLTSTLTTLSRFASSSPASRAPGHKWKSSAKSPQSTSSLWTTLSFLNTNRTQLSKCPWLFEKKAFRSLLPNQITLISWLFQKLSKIFRNLSKSWQFQYESCPCPSFDPLCPTCRWPDQARHSRLQHLLGTPICRKYSSV